MFDSVEEDEYVETINKLKGSAKALDEAERAFFRVLSCCVFGTYGLAEYWYDVQQGRPKTPSRQGYHS